MRIYAILFLFLIPLNMAAQKDSRYKFDYRILLDALDTKSKMEFKQEPVEMSKPTLRGVVRDNGSKPLSSAILQFTSPDSSRNRIIRPNSNGEFIFIADPGVYTLNVSAINCPGINGQFELHIHELLKADIVLPDIRSLISPTYMHIYSVKELSEKEIELIKQCVENKRTAKADIYECEKKGEYHMAMEI